MKNRIEISRRAMLGGMAALTAPAAAMAAAPAPEETITDRIERLSMELADALSEYQDGAFHAQVFPSKRTQWPVNLIKSPRNRMDLLNFRLAALKQVLRDAYGIEPRDHSLIQDNQVVVVLTVLAEDAATVKWFIDDGAPLLPADAGNWPRSYSRASMGS